MVRLSCTLLFGTILVTPRFCRQLEATVCVASREIGLNEHVFVTPWDAARGASNTHRPVGGVLSSAPFPAVRWVAIHLSGSPGDLWAGRPSPFRPCSGWGLPSRPGHPGRWCALTAPFHPYLCAGSEDPTPSAVGALLRCPAGVGSRIESQHTFRLQDCYLVSSAFPDRSARWLVCNSPASP
jgi:hypothetical protein